ncbi:MAG TPA: polyphosphate kinase 1 [Salinimicrobium sp.]|nr:polyphosphate kinase 1 [Salinimicrobium sp.]
MFQLDKNEVKHRDLNWLSFNERVLQEAEDENNPLYERLKFLAIFSSNLDEYFRVRVSQLRQIKKIDKSLRKKLALRPNKTVKEILKEVKKQQERFGRVYFDEIIPLLAKEGILIKDDSQFTEDQLKIVNEEYAKNIAKFLKPKIIDLQKEDELFLENTTIYFLIVFKDSDEFGIVNIPVDEYGRFFILKNEGNQHYITFLDDIIRVQIPNLFENREINGIYEIKLSRDAELYIEDEFDGVLAEKIYESLEQRNVGQPTRLLYDAAMPSEIHKKLRKLLGLGKIDMMPGGKYHNFKDFFSFPNPTDKNLHNETIEPIKHKVLEASYNYFETLSERDISLHFPYMSFSYVEKLIQQASEDEAVEKIKISLYRVADESLLTSSLLKALKNGKEVTVFIEAKARFDEKNNIDWGKKFEDAGANVLYSYPKIKVHSKIMLIQRREKSDLRNYAYIGTGNFNSKTAEIYCDHALLTADKKIGKELSRVFDVLEGKLIIPRAKTLMISPFSTRLEFTRMIIRETENARLGKKAKITAKMNSLEDPEIISLLYQASNAGVEIRLLVRGFTCLVPGVEGMSENIYMTSIVDKFLEHGRIYIFENGGDEEIFFGSADWMIRNMDRRIEVITPIKDPDIAKEFKDILEIQLNDNVKARIQDAEETNKYIKPTKGEKLIRSQIEIYNYLKKKHST